jgi:hypothetical protein
MNQLFFIHLKHGVNKFKIILRYYLVVSYKNP